jgi:WD40 repeat protein
MWATGEITFQMLTKRSTFENLGLLMRYVQKTCLFPYEQLSNRGVSYDASSFILSAMNPVSRDRISASCALGDSWIKSFMSTASPILPPLSHAPIPDSAIEYPTGELGRWTTISSGVSEVILSDVRQSRDIRVQDREIGQTATATSSKDFTDHSQKSAPASQIREQSHFGMQISDNEHLYKSPKGNWTYKEISFDNQRPQCIDFSPDGTFFVTSSFNSMLQIKYSNEYAPGSLVQVWKVPQELDLDNGAPSIECVASSELRPASIHRIKWSPVDRDLIAIVDSWAGIRFLRSLQPVGEAMNEGASLISFSPDGRNIANSTRSGIIKIIDIASCQQFSFIGNEAQSILSTNERLIQAIEYSPDGQLIAISQDQMITIWDPRTACNYPILQLQCDSEVRTLKFSPNGETLSSVTYNDGKLQVWDIKYVLNTRILDTFRRAHNVAFSSDGVSIASCDYVSKLITLLDTNTGQITIKTPSNEHIRCSCYGSRVAFSPKENVLASIYKKNQYSIP